MNYRDEVVRLSTRLSDKERLNNGGLGLAGETGEVVDLIKKHLFHDAPLDKEKMVKELGDVRWYLESICIAVGVTMDEVEAANVAKLRKRYPDGFSFEAAQAKRDEA